jgi:two-component system response regulator FixJ
MTGNARPASARAQESTEAAAEALTVHIVDDDEAVRRSLALLLGSCGHATETYRSAEAFLGALHSLSPGCAIVDIRMPGMDGLSLQTELARRGVLLPVVVVTGHADVALAVRAMKAGAVDLVEKPFSDQELLRAVGDALARVADAHVQDANTKAAIARIATLTARERDVLLRLVEGRPNKVIAHELGISPRTVEIHCANVMEKLGCRSLAEVVRIALTAGVALS